MLWRDTVTLIRRVETKDEAGRTHITYESHILNGCSWHRASTIRLNGTALDIADGVVCRIPVGPVQPRAGDLLVCGTVDVTVDNAAQYQAILDAHRADGAFVVASVSDNSRPGFPIPHCAARN